MKKRNLTRVETFLGKIEWMFELNNFTRKLVTIKNQPDNEPELAAEVMPNLTYKEITIQIYPCFWELSLEQQRAALLHECVHILLQETKMIALDLIDGKSHNIESVKTCNEKTTTTITHLLDFLLQGRLRYARKAYKDYLK